MMLTGRLISGGNPKQVTIAGQSSGAGSVMLQAMAFGGGLGELLFSNAIVASPYLPTQYDYNAFVPSQAYYALAEQAGCFLGTAFGDRVESSTIFECLVNSSSAVLMEANSIVSASGVYGTWAFTPVTDGSFIRQLPSQQLSRHRVNGARILSGNNANEGTDFVPQNITTEADLISWLQSGFPMLTSDDIAKILRYYPSTASEVSDALAELIATGPNPIDAAVQQKRANDIYGETTFVCPSYWLASAYSTSSRLAYKYQYSVLPALHGADYNGYFGPPVPYLGSEFMDYLQRIWGNFIIHSTPSVDNGEGMIDANVEAVSAFPVYSTSSPMQVNCKFW
jgi:carboxylesterase type B